MQIGEALNVQHVDLVDEEHTWNQLSNALVNVLVHHLVDLLPQFVWNTATGVNQTSESKY